jgi:hypothetical protein
MRPASDFPNWDDDDAIAESASTIWVPSVEDFAAVAGTGPSDLEVRPARIV